jgi:hypothetical protein
VCRVFMPLLCSSNVDAFLCTPPVTRKQMHADTHRRHNKNKATTMQEEG